MYGDEIDEELERPAKTVDLAVTEGNVGALVSAAARL
jgi:hypothetical protein